MSNVLRLHEAPGLTADLNGPAEQVASTDDLSRNVFGVLGLPVDALDLGEVLQKIASAADNATPLLISTPNVNFLVTSRSNSQFRDSLLMSDLCLPDGMPIVWIARFLGIPIKRRVSGADLFQALRSELKAGTSLKIFLFGGGEGAAETLGTLLNSQTGGLSCVGVLNPGFGTVDEISSHEIIETINSSKADLLAVFFSATKAQSWLLLNRERLRIPIRVQFGATINFQAGLTRRAPQRLQEMGFEWLWRIKEEPHLWRRYWNDGLKLLWLILNHVLPLWVGIRWSHFRQLGKADSLIVEATQDDKTTIIKLSGFLTAVAVGRAIPSLREALESNKQIVIDLSRARSVDPRFFGLFLMLYKAALSRSRKLGFAGVRPDMKRMFRRNGFGFLLSGLS